MNPLRILLIAAALTATLAACDGDTIIGEDSGHSLSLRSGVLTARAPGEPDANITAAGDLNISGKPVAVTPAQRDLLKKFYGEVVDIRKAGIETGKAGAAMAGHAIGAVATGLAHGDPDSIGPKIEANATEIEKKAMLICDSVSTLRTTQDAIVTTLPAFKPYAGIGADDESDCRNDHKTVRK
jgi:hypothetical protein